MWTRFMAGVVLLASVCIMCEADTTTTGSGSVRVPAEVFELSKCDASTTYIAATRQRTSKNKASKQSLNAASYRNAK